VNLVPRRWLAALVLVLALGLAACGGDSGTSLGKQVMTTPPKASATTQPAPASVESRTARATVPQLAVFDSPKATQPTMTLPNPWLVDPTVPSSTVQQVFLVSKEQPGWVQVYLPVRPNGTTGWVHAAEVSVIPNPYHIRIELGTHHITVSKDTAVLYEGTVAVGAPDTPTPTGLYYLRVLVKALDPTTVYGPYAYGLSSHSDVLETFNGGDGEIGIHGNNDSSVLGSNVTHGCVRMDNDAITALTKQLPLGTRVDIVA
jgi:lipoprotein-anchoring transpeptidase ErfK/SrfK